MNPEEIYNRIISKLKRLRGKEILLIFGEKFLLFLSFSFIGIYIVTLAESIFRFSAVERKIIFVLLMFMIFSMLITYLTKPLKIILGIDKSLSDEKLAEKVGFRFNEVKDRLLNAIQIYSNKKINREGYSEELTDEYVSRIGRELVNKDFRVALNFKSLFNGLKIFGIVFSIGILMFIFFYGVFGDSLERVFQPNKEFPIYPDFTISLKPGDLDVIRGENVEIKVIVNGKNPDMVGLFVKEEGADNFSEVELDKNGGNDFIYKIDKLKRSFEYFAKGVDDVLFQRNRVFTTQVYNIGVIYRPMIRKLKVRLDFPSYSGLGSRYLDDNNGDITALKGTNAHFEVFMNKNISEGNVIFSSERIANMNIRNTIATASFVINEDDRYKLILKDEEGITNEDPIEYLISTILDQYPAVEIIEPGKDIDLEEGMKVPLYFTIRDDFGFSRLRLAFRKISSYDKTPAKNVNNDESGKFEYIDLNIFNSSELTQNLLHDWDLSKSNILPEDEVIYFIEVYDNDNVSGPKRGVSRTFRLRFPSLAEIYATVEEIQDINIEDMEEIFERNQQLKEKLDEIALEMRRNYDASWEKRKELKNIANEQAETQKKLKDIQNRLEELIDKIEKNDLVTLETMKKYLELQELINEIASPEFKKVIEELQKSLEKQLSSPEMRNLIDKVNLTQKDMLKRIERTLSIMKQIQIEQKMDELVRKAEELLKRHKDIQKKVESTENLEELNNKKLADDEDKLKKSADELRNNMEEVAEKMSEDPIMPFQKINSSIEMFDNRKIPVKMTQMSKNLKDNEISRAGELGKEIEKDLSDLSENLKLAQKEMIEAQKETIRNAMLKSAIDLLALSKSEEKLQEESLHLDKNSSRFPSIAEKQLEILSGLSRSGQELINLSQKTFFITPEMGQALAQALIQMQNSIRELENRNGQLAASNQSKSMMALNMAVEEIRRSLKNLEGASSASGLEEYLKRLEEMAGKQNGINQKTSEFPIGAQPSLTQQAEMLRLAGEQEALRRALEELMNEMGRSSQILGDIDQIEKDMEDVVKDLKDKNLEKRTLQLQERILSRLLDAQRSLHRRDYSKKRKSETAKEYQALSPPELLPGIGEKENKIREDLLKALNEGYARDFMKLIRKYFEALNEIHAEKDN